MKTHTRAQTMQLLIQLPLQMQMLKRRPYWSFSKIQQYQLKHIKKLVTIAKKHVALYAEKKLPDANDIKTLSDIRKLPILTKQELLNASVTDVIHNKHAIDELILSKSSGSTGQALDVYYPLSSYNLFILAGLRLFQMAFPYRPWHKQTYIYTSSYPVKTLLGLYPLEFISTLTPIEETIDRLRKNPPDLLVCYPSHLRAIADKMTAEDLQKIQPKAINVNSEMSSAAERDYLSKIFNCVVFDDYSSEELTRIAGQCRYQQYHLFEDINYIEIVDDQGRPVPEGEVGLIVGTNLHNTSMPFIRYLQGDRGAIRTKTCGCGWRFRTLETLQGRKNDAFVLSTGEVLSSGYLLDLTYGVFLDYPQAVSAFCLVEENIDNWILELIPGKRWDTQLLMKIQKDMKEKLNRTCIELQCRLVTTIRKTKSGKANPIISLVKRN